MSNCRVHAGVMGRTGEGVEKNVQTELSLFNLLYEATGGCAEKTKANSFHVNGILDLVGKL